MDIYVMNTPQPNPTQPMAQYSIFFKQKIDDALLPLLRKKKKIETRIIVIRAATRNTQTTKTKAKAKREEGAGRPETFCQLILDLI